ncbi:hypothetical protein F0562_026079 [Nyssa sinensis]|uniref:CTLH/CRA C-terminal to LisH motif domain-containing protein n=1 Tax=Nyssa sinensis TaxID=561372 RepID=A0A5J5BCE1_9ASTE|nr:hypothetical protein F0562_026079 [Nyssa sinensis]
MEMEALPNGNSATTTAVASATVTTPSSKLTRIGESLKLEHQFLRVPFEHYKKTIRANHRIVEKEMSAVISGVADAADGDLSQDDAVQQLNSLVSRLQGLKRKLEEGSRTEHLQVQRCRARLDHLESVDMENLSEWNHTRLKRILVDYVLRMSYYDTAIKLAESCNIRDLVDIDVFHEAKKVIDALQNKEVAPALAWCADNKSRLKKSKVPPRRPIAHAWDPRGLPIPKYTLEYVGIFILSSLGQKLEGFAYTLEEVGRVLEDRGKRLAWALESSISALPGTGLVEVNELHPKAASLARKIFSKYLDLVTSFWFIAHCIWIIVFEFLLDAVQMAEGVTQRGSENLGLEEATERSEAARAHVEDLCTGLAEAQKELGRMEQEMVRLGEICRAPGNQDF